MRIEIEKIKQISIIIFFGVLSWCVWDLTQHTKQATNQLVEQVKLARQDTVTLATDTRNQLIGQVVDLRTDTFDFLHTVNRNLNTRLISLESNTFARIDSIESKTFDQVTLVTKNVDQLNSNMAGLIDAYRKPADSINQLIQANDIYFNCSRNAMCWSNQTASTLRQIERSTTAVANSMQRIDKSTPVIVSSLEQFSNSFAQNAPQILNNTNDITKNVSRLTKPRWYDRLIGWGVNGSLVYYNINRR